MSWLADLSVGALDTNCSHTLTQERAALSPHKILFCFVYLCLLQGLVGSGIQQISEGKKIKKVIPKLSYVNTSPFLGKNLE